MPTLSSTNGRAPLLLIALILSVAAITFLGPILTPILIAVFLYFIIRPAADALIRRHVPAWLAYLLLFVLSIVAVFWLGRIVQSHAVAFQSRLPSYQVNVQALFDRLPGGEVKESVRSWFNELYEDATKHVLGMALGSAVSFLESAILVFFYLLFIMVSAGRVDRRVRRAMEPAAAERVLAIGSSISGGVAQYMKIKTLVSLGMALCHGLILYLFGVHYWPLWTALMFVLNYITYVGSIVALVPPILLALVQFTNPLAALGLAALITGNRMAWIDYVEIRASGKSLNVDPVLLLASIAYWGWMWGMVGMVLAVPMLMGVKIALSKIESTRRWALLMSDE